MMPAIFYRVSPGHPSNGPYSYRTGGLHANALHSSTTLNLLGHDAECYGVKNFQEMVTILDMFPITHAIIEAVWVTHSQVQQLSDRYPDTQFVVRAHSKIGFLQVEPEAIPVIRKLICLSETNPNISFATNNEEFSHALREAYGKCLYLPNLYDLGGAPEKVENTRGNLKIASFGATRLLKLHPCAALAALQIARRLGKNLEFYINVDKTPGGESVRNTIRNMLADIPWAKLVEVPWQDVETFKETVASMDLVIQLSCTETFCLVAADAVASGVPVVAGPAIGWLPDSCTTNIDDTSAVASLGVKALTNRCFVAREQKYLKRFVKRAERKWLEFLTGVKAKKSCSWFL